MLLQSICSCAVHLLGYCNWSETDKLCKTELAPARKASGPANMQSADLCQCAVQPLLYGACKRQFRCEYQAKKPLSLEIAGLCL